jgi:hypothetical protein
MGFLRDKKQKHKCRMVPEEKLDDIGARIEHTPKKSLKRLAQEAGVSKFSARKATQLLNLRLYKNNSNPCLAAAQSSQQGSLLQLVSSLSSKVRMICK